MIFFLQVLKKISLQAHQKERGVLEVLKMSRKVDDAEELVRIDVGGDGVEGDHRPVQYQPTNWT